MAVFNRRGLLAGFSATCLSTGCTKFGANNEVSPQQGGSSTAVDFGEYERFEKKRRFVETDFGDIAFVENGSGRPALFLHGLGLNSYYWRGQLSRLSRQRRCIALDLMAHGHTETPDNQDVSFTAQAQMAISFLDAIDVNEFDLIGSDSGGAIAQIMAAMVPERVSSLILTNCDVHNNWPPAALEAIRASAPDGALADNFAAIVADPTLMRAKGGLAEMVFERPDLITDALTRIFLEPLTSSPARRRAFNRYVAPQDPDQLTRIESDLRELAAPALILWATEDIFFGLEWAHWLKDTLQNAVDVVEYKGAKLFFPFERVELVNNDISAFWREI